MRELKNKEQLEIGDWIVTSHDFFGKSKYPITRVTKTMAISVKPRFNNKPEDTITTRFPRIYSTFGYQAIPFEMYNTTRYTAYTNREEN